MCATVSSDIAGTAGHADEIAAALRTLGRELADVRRVVLTHFHEDHGSPR